MRPESYTPRGMRRQFGDPVSWTPWAFIDGDYPGTVKALHGKVIHVNEAHRYYTAEAECHGYRLRESFKF